MVGAVRRIWSAVRPNQRKRANRLNDAKAGWVEMLRSLWAQQDLIEHIPVIVHMLPGIVVVLSGSAVPGVAEVAPHWIVEEPILAALNRPRLARRHAPRHYGIQAH